ncbi:MAG: cysteine hydrolase family protein [Mucilaginibacter sp.]
MTHLEPKNKPALILIDIQNAFNDLTYWGPRNNEDAEDNAALLLRAWRKNNLPVFHIKHCSTNPMSPLRDSEPGNEIKEIVQPIAGEPVITKNVNSAFIGTDLEQRLIKANTKQIVMAGLTTDHCVSTSVRMAGNLGFDTYLAHDATATFDKTGLNGTIYPAQLIHETAIASLKDEFATVLLTREIIDLIEG